MTDAVDRRRRERAAAEGAPVGPDERERIRLLARAEAFDDAAALLARAGKDQRWTDPETFVRASYCYSNAAWLIRRDLGEPQPAGNAALAAEFGAGWNPGGSVLTTVSDADLVEEIRRRGSNLKTEREITVGGFRSGPGRYSLTFNGPA